MIEQEREFDRKKRRDFFRFLPLDLSLPPKELPVERRRDAVASIVYEANARIRDPVYGCLGAIFTLQQQIAQLRKQLSAAQSEMVLLKFQHQHREPFQLQPSTTASSLQEQHHLYKAVALQTPDDHHHYSRDLIESSSVWTS
ncbi:LOB domain-containing protein 4-like [Selaginella moellendorffii]|uniref:LOB domain-containing protein 4-like n=1 Tax=Selaginella moellendorffii TaxID=88036 RepID=UPI000D1C9D19|nr:LOB domain-containing protein 4-like [Selaginella moellendorffii]|eukprot:XP_024538498.1 LOB domain-containing protein 4-like [Selaginella moellendorffii]